MGIISNFQTLTGRAPVYLLAEVGNIAANKVIVTYNKTLYPDSIPSTSDFTITGTVQTISDIALDNHNIILTMSGDLLNTDILTLSYTKGTNPIQDSSGNESINLVTQSITNNI